MKARELRIGNLIEWYEPNSGDPLYVEVIGVSHQRIEAMVNGTHQRKHETYQSWKPIPLTEEWLVRFSLNNENNFRKDGLQICTYTMEKDVYCIDNGMTMIKDGIKWVHQLQNIYFSLTGEELTIKE